MNRRALIATTAAGALALFTGGVLFYKPSGGPAQKMSEDGPLLRPFAPTYGPDDAPVTIVEFFDPACEACRAFYPIVKDIMKKHKGKVRLVLRYVAFHGPSEEAIRLLEAARVQGAFTKTLKRLYETQPRWAPHGRPAASVWAMVEGLGLDIDKAKIDKNLPDIHAILATSAQDVQAAGVSKTPTFFVNGKPLPKFGVAELEELVAEEVKASS
ncbi:MULTISPECIES: thioredoxin domain-containing protein [unclassified Marinobacterium]|jgi:protein-disulfide isomerase|uniref:DsbA family protein n=1 Tax=unclassified Marinobacterium TaxID=2644139 RepID=UPI00156A69A6|nr:MULTISPECIES: thioredoxin domain-containing protein [unclassified Marinobacterium]NRP09098.1 Disulfide bond formation protein D precursor [Marinobacterium sp. xm-g-48]NRP27975.1 Disulfide bond formation protein D precursor [Marinobacterium sp. xm-d-420]NRP39608.1 Disulfide bond formation protein D precursor [Marinobacterium sp. xm-a-121]NRP53519.1 Disulfide bond formation protein D precursor [Marinobacterium sp. xm-v-242]NRP56766.1 Disulfide bond formation protein D precursor [Marinobacteri